MPSLTPFIWFNDQAHAAAKFYKTVFKTKAKILRLDGMSARFRILGQDFFALNGGPHYQLNPAFSMFLECKTQKEIDYYWKKLTAGGVVMQCGWLTDKFGLTWQVIPADLGKLIGDKNPEKAGRAMQAMLKMKKLDIKALRKAHAGK